MIEQLYLYLYSEQTAAIAFVVTILGFYILKKFMLSRLREAAEKTKTDVDDLVVSLLESIRWPFSLVLAIIVFTFFASNISIQDTPLLNVLFILIFTYQIGKFVNVIFEWTQREMAEAGTHIMSGFKTMLVMIVWAFGIVAVLSAFGYDVTSLVAGLGIGGLAVALALQNLLGDVLSSASIFFDKPFSVGDHIQVGDKDGVVEQVGLKTTRIRSPRGELIIIANKDLTNTVVQNFGALERRRIVMEIGLEYDTTNEKIDKMRKDLTQMTGEMNGITFHRFFFKSFGDSALILELVFYVESGAYSDYIDKQHEVNLMIKEYVENQEINMAFPTQTVYLKQT